ncbi:hypothetical protein BIU88_06880 [Chlorobaculum limnaeum]|uniref:Addiction module protein n=2 Tax=Chlorobaculum limnaeum TaxID=274537 RepID=A0A1D8D1L8_CHLLM|nr:hypothetical protein BIU88_06880 [Chlorobaculum limnaeum]
MCIITLKGFFSRRKAKLKAHDRVIEEALTLSADIRLNLIEKLLMSFNQPADEEIDRLWAGNAELRIAQVEEGTVKFVIVEEVFAKPSRKYKFS